MATHNSTHDGGGRDISSGSEEEVDKIFAEMLDPFVGDLLHLLERDSHWNLLDKVEKLLLRRALTEAKGNQVQAARLLGISRSTLRNRADKYKLSL